MYVVDDGSRDATAAAARRAGAVVIRHPTTRGKGRALASGIGRALAAGAALIATVDADGQHPPAELPRLVAPVDEGLADLAIGARTRTPGVMPAPRRLSNRLSSWVLGIILGEPIPDAQSGFRVFSRAVAESVRPATSRYEFETEFLYIAARRGYRLAWVPVPTVYGGAPSHFRNVRDTGRLVGLYTRLGARRLMGR